MGLAIGAVLHDVLYVSTVVEITQQTLTKNYLFLIPFWGTKTIKKTCFCLNEANKKIIYK